MSARKPWLLVAGLTVTWLILTGSFTPGQLLLGLAVSLVMVFGFRAVRPIQPRIRKPANILRLLGRVFVDIVQSNYHVARIVLGLTGERGINAAFVDIPLRLRDPHGLAVLAAILTSTPGTVWANLSDDGSVLTVHVLDLTDEETWKEMVRHRYESLLLEIFE